MHGRRAMVRVACAAGVLVSAGVSAQRAGVGIVAFAPASGVLAAGDEAVSTAVVVNRGSARAVHLGYSVQLPSGSWLDVASHRVPLAARSRSAPQSKRLPLPASAEHGWYRVVMAVWDRPPESAGAVRLATADRPLTFHVGAAAELGGSAWSAADHPLGRGRVRAERVRTQGERATLAVGPSGCDGGELRTRERHLYGGYVARLQTPRAPGSISALFLYEDVATGNDEIDVEILNDGSRTLLLSVWVDGRQTRHASLRLPFDPSAGFHDYGIHFRPGDLRFTVDGRTVRRWTAELPHRPMRLALNAWWPAWLPCAAPGTDAPLRVEWVRF